jgi:hypothetical protein
MEIWYISSRPTTGWKKIMAKINVRIPEPKTEYDLSNQKQINRSLALIVEQLNSTFLKDLKEDTERYTWFGLG